MAGCCDPSGYRRVFNTRGAHRAANAYRRKGLDATARAMVDALGSRLAGVTVLEGGSGAGAAHVEMLRRGAARAISVDLSAAYEPAAEAIAAEHGVAGSIERRVGDFVELAPDLPTAAVVYLNRVVCCYPDMEGLVDAAAGRAERYVALSYPRNRWFVRFGLAAANRYLRWRAVPFGVFVHDPLLIARRMQAAGFTGREAGTTLVWHWGIWERTSG